MGARALSGLLAAALVAQTGVSSADETPEEPAPRFEVVDFGSIPVGHLPAFPADDSAPATLQKGPVADLEVETVREEKTSPKRAQKPRPKKRIKRRPTKGTRLVEVRPAKPALGLLYAPSSGNSEFDGESSQRMSCEPGSKPSPLRWEKLSIAGDGTARLEVNDLWFDPASCSLAPGSTSVVTLGTIAREGGQPWLFAVRNETSVTFVMPRTNELAAETMVGAPLTVRGGFTRVTMPLGRWGSASMFGSVPALAIENPGAAAKPTDSSHEEQGPVEVSLELAQTTTEAHPTLLVRTREPPQSVASKGE